MESAHHSGWNSNTNINILKNLFFFCYRCSARNALGLAQTKCVTPSVRGLTSSPSVLPTCSMVQSLRHLQDRQVHLCNWKEWESRKKTRKMRLEQTQKQQWDWEQGNKEDETGTNSKTAMRLGAGPQYNQSPKPEIILDMEDGWFLASFSSSPFGYSCRFDKI